MRPFCIYSNLNVVNKWSCLNKMWLLASLFFGHTLFSSFQFFDWHLHPGWYTCRSWINLSSTWILWMFDRQWVCLVALLCCGRHFSGMIWRHWKSIQFFWDSLYPMMKLFILMEVVFSRVTLPPSIRHEGSRNNHMLWLSELPNLNPGEYLWEILTSVLDNHHYSKQ